MALSRPVAIGGTVIVIGGALLGGAELGGWFTSSTVKSPDQPTQTGATPTPSRPTSGLVRFVDRADGFSIAYPSTWTRFRPTDRAIPLIVARRPDASVLVRITHLGFKVTRANLKTLQAVTQDTVKAGPGIKVLGGPKRITLDGLPGFFYLYTFHDSVSGKTGVHAHYFVAKDDRMYGLVFQAIPSSRIGSLVGVFDQIRASFRQV